LDFWQNYKKENKMINYQTVTIESIDATTTDHIIVDRGNGEFTSFPAVDGNPVYEAFKLQLEAEAAE